VLIILNVLVFFVELSGGQAFVRDWAFIPARFASDPAGQVHTIFSAMFMHGGWLHLFGNMLYLWIFGDIVEDAFGPLKFVLFYLLCGIAATLAQYYVSPSSRVPNVGASGAIAGVLGAYLLLFPGARVRVLVYNQIVAMPALIVLGMWVLLQASAELVLLRRPTKVVTRVASPIWRTSEALWRACCSRSCSAAGDGAAGESTCHDMSAIKKQRRVSVTLPLGDERRASLLRPNRTSSPLAVAGA
jgi:hypothetical protein